MSDLLLNTNSGLFVGSEYLVATVTSSNGRQASTFSVQLNPPRFATRAVPCLAGWSLSYSDKDHHIRTQQIHIDRPHALLPTTVTGKLLLKDKNGDDAWFGSIWIKVLYFTSPTQTNFPGYLLCGSEWLTHNSDYTEGQVPETFSLKMSPPGNAVLAEALLTGWSLAYSSGDHHIQTQLVRVDDLPPLAPFTHVKGALLLRDKNGDDSWSGHVSIQTLYFAPYWS